MTPIGLALLASLLAQASGSTNVAKEDAIAHQRAGIQDGTLRFEENDSQGSVRSIDTSNTAVRLLAETTGALAGAATTFAVGYYLVAIPYQCRQGTEDCEGGAWRDPLFVAVWGLGPGAWLGGMLGGSQSSWWPPLAGVLAGVALSYGVTYAAGGTITFPLDWLMYYSMGLLGAIAGAELSHLFNVASLPAPSALAPIVGPDFRGVALIWCI